MFFFLFVYCFIAEMRWCAVKLVFDCIYFDHYSSIYSDFLAVTILTTTLTAQCHLPHHLR